MHVDRCRLLGHDPYLTPIFDPTYQYFWDPVAANWQPYTGSGEIGRQVVMVVVLVLCLSHTAGLAQAFIFLLVCDYKEYCVPSCVTAST